MAKAKIDPMALLKQIKADEDAAYLDFMEKQSQKRAKALADVIDPLKKERSELAQQINEASVRISEIDKELAKLTGKELKATPKTGAGSRFRPSEDELAKEADRWGKQWKEKFGTKNEVTKKDVLGLLDPKWKNHLAKLIDAWNKGGSNKIGTNGKEKAASRYLMH